MHEARHADFRRAVEGKRIEKTLRDTRENRMDALESGNGLEINVIVEHEHVAALHQWDAHAAREKPVLRVKLVRRAGREENDQRLGTADVGRAAKRFEQCHRGVRDRGDGLVPKQFGRDPREQAAVLHHAGKPVDAAEMLAADLQFAVRAALDANGSKMQICAPRGRKPDGGALQIGTAQHGTNRDGTAPQDFARTVHVREKHLEGFHALGQSPREAIPILLLEPVR